MKKNRLLLLASAITLFTASCKKGDTGPIGPTGPAGPSLKGVINGHVSIYDQYGARTVNGLGTVQVTLKGGRTRSADANGYFSFDSVYTGTYYITASATGLATSMINNIGFVGDTVYTPIRLSAKPDFNLSAFRAYHNTGSQFDSLVITLPGDTRARNVIVFANKTAAVSNDPANYQFSVIKVVPAMAWPSETKVVIRIHATEFNNANIFYGEQTYFAAYSYVVNDASVYTDPVTGKSVYNAVGNALIDSAVAP